MRLATPDLDFGEETWKGGNNNSSFQLILNADWISAIGTYNKLSKTNYFLKISFGQMKVTFNGWRHQALVLIRIQRRPRPPKAGNIWTFQHDFIPNVHLFSVYTRDLDALVRPDLLKKTNIMVNTFNNMRERQWSLVQVDVDDIFAVFDTKAISLDNFVAKLNNHFPTIKFTYEMEHNEQLQFLDVLVIRNSENKLEFDVHIV
ncbi:hypothetical protein NQ318_012662 [Aromia moschata]|uniref:Uncharacterized protein n=1 Tax=Aromia moschata TaxID=1265417 RepID=A0AAV8YHQ0_9CUCU|nr:hypothetical protein NQ318_012662 [Aromia moschata]